MILHASSVAWQGRGVLILGPSGSGKSTLALELMAHGAVLIADDRTEVGPDLTARAPAALAGLIEARGVGLLRADHAPARLVLAVDLGQPEPDRLPQMRHSLVHDMRLPLVLGQGRGHLAYAILQYLKGGRQA
ncbi:HPr kinase/phosphorylase [Falsirhodobacter sp. 20TX0035]|uniref:HPr kinase/phosphorylase n=1 Tax=Falsirhodobacter sp. 20TX0035 TaxID=3022019 RepID=UPI00232CDBB1|nr:HPr kinase/phosphatase C-terminal domain-containing protein [Falsirhodobacter sp. 20TX0035]MDB6454601.1 HPr kinase/phosphatase C-terminal domain-containing protein [Falsirhodobacter sp. 20TX0035]